METPVPPVFGKKVVNAICFRAQSPEILSDLVILFINF